MKESLSGFPFEYNSRPFEKRSWTLVEEGNELVGHSIGHWLSGLCSSESSFVCKLVSCVYGFLTLCYLYPTGGSKNRPKLLTKQATSSRSTTLEVGHPMRDSTHVRTQNSPSSLWICTEQPIILHRRCPWCNGYRHRKWTRRHEFKSWTTHSTNTLGKGMNPIILPPAMGK